MNDLGTKESKLQSELTRLQLTQQGKIFIDLWSNKLSNWSPVIIHALAFQSISQDSCIYSYASSNILSMASRWNLPQNSKNSSWLTIGHMKSLILAFGLRKSPLSNGFLKSSIYSDCSLPVTHCNGLEWIRT